MNFATTLAGLGMLGIALIPGRAIYVTTPSLAKRTARGYVRAMRGSGFIGTVSESATMISIEDLEPSEIDAERDGLHIPSALKTEDGQRLAKRMIDRRPIDPIVVEGREIIDGHHRVSIAKSLGIRLVPAIESSEEYA